MKAKGSITVFLSLILILIIAIFGSLLESARVNVAREIVLDDAYLSVQNVLGEYQRELWDDYHVFFLDGEQVGGDEGVERLADSYLKEMVVEGEKNFMGTNAGFENLGLFQNMTEGNCKYFVKQASAYMKYAVPADVLKKNLEKAGLLEAYEKGAEAFKKVIKLKTEVEKKLLELGKIKQKAEKSLSKMNEKLRDLKALREEFREKSLSPKKLRRLKKKIKKLLKKSGKHRTKAESRFEAYKEKKEEGKKEAEEFEKEIEARKEELQEENYYSLKESMNEILPKDDDAFRDRTVKNKGETERLSELAGSEESTKEELDAAIDAITPEEEKKEGYEITKKDEKEVENYEKNTREAVGEGKSAGFLLSALGGGEIKVSEKKVRENEWREIPDDGVKEGNGIIDRGLLFFYLKQHFGNFMSYRKKEEKRDSKREALDYGIEYISIGKDSDEGNLTSVVERIFGIRTMVWFSHKMTEPKTVQKATAMATAIAGIFGIPAAISIIKTGIIMGWSMADARKDVKKLLKGEEIPIHPRTEKIKVKYENFLDMFLLLAVKKLPVRTVKLIEHNMKFRYSESFSADRCYAGVSGAVKGKVKPMIFRLPFMEKMAGQKVDPWEFGYVIKKSLTE